MQKSLDALGLDIHKGLSVDLRLQLVYVDEGKIIGRVAQRKVAW